MLRANSEGIYSRGYSVESLDQHGTGGVYRICSERIEQSGPAATGGDASGGII